MELKRFRYYEQNRRVLPTPNLTVSDRGVLVFDAKTRTSKNSQQVRGLTIWQYYEGRLN